MKRVLLVDDDPDILEALELLMVSKGFETEKVSSGKEVYKKIKEFKPNLVLLDVLLSGMDGRDICKKLKSQDETKKIPVVMISAHPAASKSIIECGAEDFLAKPFEIDHLFEKVDRHLK
jgi:DNA-binding response OmpR family regulator